MAGRKVGENYDTRAGQSGLQFPLRASGSSLPAALVLWHRTTGDHESGAMRLHIVFYYSAITCYSYLNLHTPIPRNRAANPSSTPALGRISTSPPPRMEMSSMPCIAQVVGRILT